MNEYVTADEQIDFSDNVTSIRSAKRQYWTTDN